VPLRVLLSLLEASGLRRNYYPPSAEMYLKLNWILRRAVLDPDLHHFASFLVLSPYRVVVVVAHIGEPA
jgi:hypothetical protein